MRKIRLWGTLVLGMGLTWALLWILGYPSPPVAAAPTAELRVCPSGCAYSSIQAAVDAAQSGDVIKVAAGLYSDVSARPALAGYYNPPASGLITQALYISKTVTVRGGYTTANGFADPPDPAANPTTLDAGKQGRGLVIGGASIAPTVEGLRITGGDAGGLGGERFGGDAGGGVYIVNATATISDCRIFNNSASKMGGGVYLLYSPSTLNGNNIISNTTHSGGSGGGGLALYNSSAALNGNTIASNTANYGGGLHLNHHSDATLNGNAVISNTAGWNGGGLYLNFHSDAALTGNVIISNTAEWKGGGLNIYECSVTLTNNVLADNHADDQGSALYLRRSSLRLLHTTIARNSGGDGSGVYVADWNGEYNTVALTNTILVSHTVGISVTSGNTLTVNTVLWHNTPVTISQGVTAVVAAQNQYAGDPAFQADGYHLSVASAALDRGVDAGVATDIDGEPRPIDAGYDIGADELRRRYIYLPLTVKNK